MSEAHLRPCPLCGVDIEEGIARCVACGIVLWGATEGSNCPSCGKPASGDQCACGAILTLAKLADMADPALKMICLKCKNPFSSRPSPCPRCGGTVVPIHPR